MSLICCHFDYLSFFYQYYFSKVNLRRDKFMRNTMSENDGWMPLESLLTFIRLKQLSTDKDLVWKIVKTSESLKTDDEIKKIVLDK